MYISYKCISAPVYKESTPALTGEFFLQILSYLIDGPLDRTQTHSEEISDFLQLQIILIAQKKSLPHRGRKLVQISIHTLLEISVPDSLKTVVLLCQIQQKFRIIIDRSLMACHKLGFFLKITAYMVGDLLGPWIEQTVLLQGRDGTPY